MKVSIEFDTKNPTAAVISFDGEVQGYLTRVDLKLKAKGLNYMNIERHVGNGREMKKFKEQIFKLDTDPAPKPSEVLSDIPEALEIAQIEDLPRKPNRKYYKRGE